jgi:hypothetical protein
MKIAVAHPDRVVLEAKAGDLHNLIGAVRGYEADQRKSGSPFGHRLQDLLDTLLLAEQRMWEQDARARGITVEGDEPFEAGAF